MKIVQLLYNLTVNHLVWYIRCFSRSFWMKIVQLLYNLTVNHLVWCIRCFSNSPEWKSSNCCRI